MIDLVGIVTYNFRLWKEKRKLKKTFNEKHLYRNAKMLYSGRKSRNDEVANCKPKPFSYFLDIELYRDLDEELRQLPKKERKTLFAGIVAHEYWHFIERELKMERTVEPYETIVPELSTISAIDLTLEDSDQLDLIFRETAADAASYLYCVQHQDLKPEVLKQWYKDRGTEEEVELMAKRCESIKDLSNPDIRAELWRYVVRKYVETNKQLFTFRTSAA